MIDTSILLKKWNIIQCDKIQPNTSGRIFQDYLKFEIKRLIDEGFIESQINAHCEKHNLDYTSLPFLVKNNRVFYTQCPKCEEEIKTIEIKKNDEEDKKRKQEILRARGIVDRFFIVDVDYSKGIVEQCCSLLQEPLKKNLVIVGNVGCGKSTFAYELCKKYYDYNLVAVIENANYLVSRFKQNYSNIEILIKEFTNTDLIIIDEIDSIKLTDFFVIDELISFCYDTLKKICFIGNTTKEDFFSALSQKSISRLYNECIFIFGNNKDLRRELQ